MNGINLLKSLMAGLAVSLGATAYLSVEFNVIGGTLFSVGLLAIYLFDWNLYTGKCCYLPESPKTYVPIVIMAFFGNLIGTAVIGYVFRFVGLSVVERAEYMVTAKLGNSYLNSFILAIFCGILMSIAVLGYRKQSDDFGRALIVALPIIGFVVAGFEHVIANMFYVSLANMWSIQSVFFILACGAGNAVGCSLIPLSLKLTTKAS